MLSKSDIDNWAKANGYEIRLYGKDHPHVILLGEGHNSDSCQSAQKELLSMVRPKSFLHECMGNVNFVAAENKILENPLYRPSTEAVAYAKSRLEHTSDTKKTAHGFGIYDKQGNLVTELKPGYRFLSDRRRLLEEAGLRFERPMPDCALIENKDIDAWFNSRGVAVELHNYYQGEDYRLPIIPFYEICRREGADIIGCDIPIFEAAYLRSVHGDPHEWLRREQRMGESIRDHVTQYGEQTLSVHGKNHLAETSSIFPILDSSRISYAVVIQAKQDNKQ